jgi:hypothetical protein
VAGRLGKWVALVTVASCAAFLLLPFVAPAGNPWPFLALTVLWTATSSALRAPPLVLLGKYVPKPAQPWLASLMLFGLGVAGALSPYLTVLLREADPRLPFAIASIAVLAVVASQLNKRPGIPALLPWTPIAVWLAASVLLSAAARRARSREPAPRLAGA